MAGRLILASTSPRRQELLRAMRVPFDIDSADVNEVLDGDPRTVTGALAQRKAKAVLKRHPLDLVLAADTLVVREGLVLGKPVDAADARRMLSLLSGGWHEVMTGVCLADGGTGAIHTQIEVTKVRFDPMDDRQIDAYVASGEPFGKAGAYAIQGLAGMYIPEISGSYSNVVGLPTALVRRMLVQASFEAFAWDRA